MIVYGSNSSHLKTAQVTNEMCQNCYTKGPITMSVFGRYAHVFWIPTLPIGKTGASQCENCKEVLQPKQMPSSLKTQYVALKAEAKIPVWQFSGLIIIGLFFSWIFYSSGQDKKQDVAYLEAPQVGDVYEVKIEGGHYSLLKVAAVGKDSIQVHMNDYEVDRSTGLSKIDIDKNYATASTSIARATLQKMQKEGDLLGVNRK